MPKHVPSYSVFPGDYLAEVIAVCSIATQGVWMRMEMVMATCDRYGYLEHCRKPMPDQLAALRCGVTLEVYLAALKEMEDMGWLVREARTLILVSEALLDQEAKRAGTRDRVRKHRAGQSELELKPDSERFERHLRSEPESASSSPPSSNSLETKEVSNANETDEKHACTGKGKGKGKGEGKGTGFVLPGTTPQVENLLTVDRSRHPISFDATEYAAPTAADLIALATEQARGFREKTEPAGQSPDIAELYGEIALASPAGVNQGWTVLSIHGNSRILTPIVEAVDLENREQGVGMRNAALWLLERVRTITGLVKREAGWERYWTVGRMQRFWQDTEYRNLAKFNAGTQAAQGGGNGKRGGRTDGNAEALQRALAANGSPAGDRLRAGGTGGRTGPGPEQGGDGAGVHRGDGAVDGGAVRGGVQPGAGAVSLLSVSGGASGARFPS